MPTPDSANNPASQIGAILANAELQVKEIVAAAERRADEVHQQARHELDERSSELAKIANELIASSAVAQKQLQRLNALGPLTPQHDDDGPAPAAAERPSPADESSSNVHPWSGTLAAAPQSSNGATPHGTTGAEANGSSSSFTADGAQWVTSPGRAPDQGAPVTQGAPAAQASDAASGSEDGDLPIIGGSDHDAQPADSNERMDSARLVALSMAASGRSRDEVEAHVRDELGIVDHGPLIDYVFGISAPASIVPSWPPRRRRRTA